MDSINSEHSSTSTTKRQVPEDARIEWKQFLRLVDRGSKQGIEITDGTYEDYDVATSSDNPDKRYVVNAVSCTCPAGEAGMACKHRALYLIKHIDEFDAVVYVADPESADLETEKV